ncbi:alpha/beta hydrolase family protein [Longimicrobium sp.]|uniref:alpha/beta hydrolase family protein n=1 Tax=Longimicrobium sp. TaxID=2029185 RepID=UPI003B3A8B94
MHNRLIRRPGAVRLHLALAFAAAAVAAVPAPAQDDLPLHLFAYDRAAPLELQSSPIGQEGEVAIHGISYASPKGGRVNGRLFVPRGRGPFAGVILAHGAPGNAEAFTGRAVYIARHGAVVIAIDAPFNRRPGGPTILSPQDSVEQVQLIVDLQRAVDVLLARPDVDSARLAYVGRSYGGATGAVFAGVERRLTTSILASADGGITTRFTAPGAPPPPPGQEERARAWLASMQPIEGLRFVGRANGSILFQNGRQDQIVPVARAEALHAAAPAGKEVRWYDAPHALNPAAYVDQLRWLSQTVGTTPPGPEDEAGPQIPPPPTPQPQPRQP